jgi:biopolymer transport protein ExbD
MAVSAYYEDNPEASAGRDIAAINITPLVDVLLVLLIIFMVAAPVLTHRIDLDLPQRGPHPPTPPAATIDLRIDATGAIAWNGSPQPLSTLEALMAVEAQRATRDAGPLLRIDASGDADYGRVAQVLAAARNAGLDRIGFVER